MTTTPRPLAEPRPLVEAWGVRLEGGGWFGSYPDREDAEWRTRKDGGTVVPLIAADRLTDEALVEAVADSLCTNIWERDYEQGDPPCPRHMHEAERALAALRAHLEGL